MQSLIAVKREKQRWLQIQPEFNLNLLLSMIFRSKSDYKQVQDALFILYPLLRVVGLFRPTWKAVS